MGAWIAAHRKAIAGAVSALGGILAFIAAHQVGETRCEATESDPPQGLGMCGDDIFRAQAGQLADLFEVRSPGVIDLAGNALDGEFTGKLPSGDGRPGGNFIVQLIVPNHSPSKARRPGRGQMHTPHH